MAILFIILTIILTALGQICLKKSAVSGSGWNLFSNYFIWAGLGLYGLSTLTYLMVLKNIKIAVAFPIIFGCTSVLVVYVASIFFREMLTLTNIIGVLLIITGVFFATIK